MLLRLGAYFTIAIINIRAPFLNPLDDGLVSFFSCHFMVSLLKRYFFLFDMQANEIRDAGYPVEIHNVETSDGYILQLHRIRNTKTDDTTQTIAYEQQEIILLGHGLGNSGGQYFINGNKSLPFMLSNKNFDVWIFNSRGISYSLKHNKFNVNDKEFWDYSFHEIGVYDLSAVIRYISSVTERKKIHYVGHSQGCAALLALLSTKPEYNKYIDNAFLLGPASFMTHMWDFPKMLIAEHVHCNEKLGVFKTQSKGSLILKVTEFLCSFRIFGTVCSKALHKIYGDETNMAENTVSLLSL